MFEADVITVTYPDGSTRRYPRGVLLREVCQHESMVKEGLDLLACEVNNFMLSLNERLDISSSVVPVHADSRSGSYMYRRTLSFILSMASAQVFPERRLVISHTIGHAIYFHFEGHSCVSKQDIDLLKRTMRNIISSNYRIQRINMEFQQALDWFESQKQHQTAALIRIVNKSRVRINYCAGYLDLHFSPLCNETGLMKLFDLQSYREGMMLHYPSTYSPHRLSPFVDNPALFRTYTEHEEWGEKLQVQCVADLNRITADRKRLKQFILVCEARHQRCISDLVSNIKDHHKLVLIAGPSSSGKTTFSKKVSIQLRTLGRVPVTISLDDYYLDRKDTPLDESGAYDFEAVEALDLPLLNDHFVRLISGELVETPTFDFKTGTRGSTKHPVQLPENGILVVEGLHALNDRLTESVPAGEKFKVFISPLTQLNIDDHIRISTSDSRLIRRMVRDHQFRGHSASATFRMWPNVLRGENTHIYPFQNSADFVFNSALEFELPVLSVLAVPLLRDIPPTSRHYGEARRLIRLLTLFGTVDPKYILQDSILREFIGGCYYEY